MLYILDESSYDKHQEDSDRIFRIASQSSKEQAPWVAVARQLALQQKIICPK